LHEAPPVDTIVATETPEGILLELRPAGLTLRLYAFLLDWMIRLAALWTAFVVLTLMGGVGGAMWLILLFVLEWLYPMVFELLPGGATPGKRVFKLRVIMDSGLPVTPGAAVTRNLLRVADFLPFAFAAAVVSMLVRNDFKRLGDIAAGTLVVHEPRPVRRTTLADVVPMPPARPLGQGAQAAIIAFAARAPGLSIDRLDELAALAAPVSGDTGRAGVDVTRRVLGVAEWLRGRRP
jgi:uncharacterized RDD family membrane protein YckC